MLDHQTYDINLVEYLQKHLKGPLPSNLTELQWPNPDVQSL